MTFSVDLLGPLKDKFNNHQTRLIHITNDDLRGSCKEKNKKRDGRRQPSRAGSGRAGDRRVQAADSNGLFDERKCCRISETPLTAGNDWL